MAQMKVFRCKLKRVESAYTKIESTEEEIKELNIGEIIYFHGRSHSIFKIPILSID